jgi:hypothetical protein
MPSAVRTGEFRKDLWMGFTEIPEGNQNEPLRLRKLIESILWADVGDSCLYISGEGGIRGASSGIRARTSVCIFQVKREE